MDPDSPRPPRRRDVARDLGILLGDRQAGKGTTAASLQDFQRQAFVSLASQLTGGRPGMALLTAHVVLGDGAVVDSMVAVDLTKVPLRAALARFGKDTRAAIQGAASTGEASVPPGLRYR